VGGSVPLFDEIVISLKAMDKVEGFDPVSGVLSCEPGCVLQRLNEDTLQQHGY
jgi:D-2-hydroxyglutarate dehydrogenase